MRIVLLLSLSIVGTIVLVVLAGAEALVPVSVILAAVAQLADTARRDG